MEIASGMTGTALMEDRGAAVLLFLSRDRMTLEMELRLPKGARPATWEEMREAIRRKGVVHGVDEEVLYELAESPVYSRRIPVARGKAPGKGTDGWLDYLIATQRKLRPRLREDGTVDFRDIGFLQNVQAGQPLCRIHPPAQGEEGMDVLGNPLEGLPGKAAPDPEGKNTVFNGEKTVLYAACDGNVEVVHGRIHVNDVLRIEGNVDNSTGDIAFPGDVVVTGDVLSGFRVTSGGSVAISGNVEGAEIKAAGDITVGEGINGMYQGSLVAGGSIRCPYIQSTFIRAAGDIYADTVMHCTTECGGDMELQGRRGTLVGGRTSLEGCLRVQRLGANSHIATVISLQAESNRKREIAELKGRLATMELEHNKLTQIITRSAELQRLGKLTETHVSTMEKVKHSYRQLQKNRQEAEERLRELQTTYKRESTNNHVQCRGRIHAGVQIAFGPLVKTVKQSVQCARVSASDGEIVIGPLP